MTAWEVLVSNSTIPATSIAWDHLNNQAGGTGVVYLTGGFGVKAEISTQSLNATVSEQSVLLSIEELTTTSNYRSDSAIVNIDELSIKT